jgi:indolepyruvate ferredoxin oxidoreductase alpha subunit
MREIRSFSTAEAPVVLATNPIVRKPKGFVREKHRWISTTFNVLENHRKLHHKLERLGQRFESSPFNRIVSKGAHQAVIAAGFTYSKLIDVALCFANPDFPTQKKEALGKEVAQAASVNMDGFAVLKLGTIHPLPRNTIAEFLSTAESVTVLEDNEPYVENKVKAIAHDAQLDVQVLGKTTGHVTREGELSKEDIARILEHSIKHPVSSIKHPVSSETKKSFCDGCPYTPTFQVLSQVIKELGEEPVIIAEPGCGVKLNAPPFEMLDVKYSMGSAIGIASGLARSRAKIKPIAVCGDSSFFHTGINGLMNVVENRVNIFIMVLDNSVTALTGYQPHPGTGRDARGRETAQLDIAEIARACHVPFVTVVDPDDAEATKLAFRRALTSNELSMVVVRKPCPRGEG